MAQQLENNQAIDSLNPGKRSRGRPPVKNPLSQAERARRYREKKRAAKEAGQVTAKSKHIPELESEILRLNNELEFYRQFADQRKELDQLKRQNADLRSIVETFIEARQKKKAIPADVFRNICQSYLRL